MHKKPGDNECNKNTRKRVVAKAEAIERAEKRAFYRSEAKPLERREFSRSVLVANTRLQKRRKRKQKKEVDIDRYARVGSQSGCSVASLSLLLPRRDFLLASPCFFFLFSFSFLSSRFGKPKNCTASVMERREGSEFSMSPGREV